MSFHAETMTETRPLGLLGDLLRSAFNGSASEEPAESPRPSRQEKLLHAARTACAGTVEW